LLVIIIRTHKNQ